MDIDTRYALIRIDDERGTKVLVARTITKPEAEQRLGEILSKEEKAHDKKYDIVPYKIGHLGEFLKSENISA